MRTFGSGLVQKLLIAAHLLGQVAAWTPHTVPRAITSRLAARCSIVCSEPPSPGVPPQPLLARWRRRASAAVKGFSRLSVPEIIFDIVTEPLANLAEARMLRHRRRDRPNRIILVRHGESQGCAPNPNALR